MQARHRAQPIIGASAPHPVAQGLRALAVHVLVRAAKDATSSDPWERALALEWLNSDDGRAMAQALGLHWPASARPLTTSDLRVPARYTYFEGD